MSSKLHLIALVSGFFFLADVSATTDPQDNVIVSAYRTTADRPDVGSAVSTIDRQLIENRQAIFATDLLQNLPSLAVSRSGNFGAQTAIRIRGAEANHVLVRIDGIEVNDPAADDSFAFSHLTANEIERIEVVRGPQSAVWGSDALAGIIDITTRRSTDRLTSDAFVEGGAFDTLNGGIHVGMRDKNSGIDLTASYLDSDGTNISRSGTEEDGYENLTVNLRTDTVFADILQLDGSIRYRDSTKEFDAVDFSTGLPADSNRETTATQSTIGVGGKLSLFEGFWTQSLRVTAMTTDNENFVDDTKDSKTAADKYGVYYQNTLNFTAGPTEESAQQITLAIDFEQENFEQHGTATIFGDPNQDQDLHNTGLVGEYRATGFGGLSFALGLRYDDNSEFDDITTYRTSAAYHFEAVDSRFHTSFGTGQKSPTFAERFGFFSDQFQGNRNLKPEQSKGFDVGYEQRVAGGRMVADITYFRRRLKDEINGFFFDPSFGQFTAVNRDGTSNSKGVEIELSADIIEGLTTVGSYTYTDASQPGTTGQQQREIRRPRHMAALNLDYAFLQDRARINLNVAYSGEQTDTFFPPTPPFQEPVSLDAYTLVNLGGSFAISENVSVLARIENLFDETYENVFGFATPGIGGFVGARVKFSN